MKRTVYQKAKKAVIVYESALKPDQTFYIVKSGATFYPPVRCTSDVHSTAKLLLNKKAAA